jgi:hypothetical protein
VTGTNTVKLSISSLPRRASASFNPTAVTVSGTDALPSTLKITADSRTPTGNYTTTITGNNGSTTHTSILSLTIQ